MSTQVELPVAKSSGLAADLMAGLAGGSGPSGWPSNVLLYLGASPSSTVSFSDNLVSRFGMVVSTGVLGEKEFLSTVEAMASHQALGLTSDQIAQSASWAQSRGGLTVRNASLFCSMLASS